MPRKRMETRVCLLCGREFVPRTSRHRFCSYECYRLYNLLPDSHRNEIISMIRSNFIDFSKLVSILDVRIIGSITQYLKSRYGGESMEIVLVDR